MSTSIENFKVTFSQRSHNPVFKQNSNWSIGVDQQAPIVQDPIIGMGHPKRRFPEPRAVEEEFKASRKPLYRPEYAEEYELRGKRPISAPIPKVVKAQAKKKHPEISSKEYTIDQALARKTKVIASNGESVSRIKSMEFNMETHFNRKQRIHDEIQQRNGINIATPGDKAYKEADREPGFYAKGGLVVGSTNKITKSAKPSLRKSNSGLKTKTLGPSYAEKLIEMEREHEMNQVKFLTNAIAKEGHPGLPSWEEKTGMFLIDPDYEAY